MFKMDTTRNYEGFPVFHIITDSIHLIVCFLAFCSNFLHEAFNMKRAFPIQMFVALFQSQYKRISCNPKTRRTAENASWKAKRLKYLPTLLASTVRPFWSLQRNVTMTCVCFSDNLHLRKVTGVTRIKGLLYITSSTIISALTVHMSMDH